MGQKKTGAKVKNKKEKIFLICCCDDRIALHNLAKKAVGELFVLRNIGNLVPPYKASDTSVAAAIEYAVNQLEIPEIVVCGHSDCGGMKAVLAQDTKDETNKESSCLHDWLTYAISPDQNNSLNELSKANVLFQIKNLMTYPAVAKRVQAGTLKIHGWWLDLDTGEIDDINI